MAGTFWAIVPTLIAVIVSLLTKEVFLSLLVGIFAGAIIIAKNPIEAINEVFNVMAQKTGASEGGLGNAGILIFIIELGLLVTIINKSGGTAALSYRLMNRIRSKKGALLTTAGLGCMIFMDDYFNRLAVGTVMKPIFDKFGLSRIKLAHIVVSVSVSICMLVPISSWASAITGNIGEGMEGAFNAYLKTLICNFYPILTLAFLLIAPILGVEIPGMTADIETTTAEIDKPKGNPLDLILPIAALVVSSLALMTKYDSEIALAMGGAIAILFCLLLYLPRKIMTVKEFTGCFSDGFKSVADVIMILVLAWTLTGICEKLDIAAFIGGLTSSMGSAKSLLPGIMFVAAMGTAFATGTAWGTFGMLVPLAVPMFEPFSTLQILTISAVLSGSVFGNQVSPISDSTLLASKVCECDHISFIKAQLPGALTLASIALLGFLISGLCGHIWAGWIAVTATFSATLTALSLKNRFRFKRRKALRAK